MKALVLVPVLLLSACALAPRPGAVAAPWLSLHDGEGLSGWHALGDAIYTSEGDSILGRVGGGGQSFLVTERTFADFVLEVDVKPELPGNSGIQVRSHVNSRGRVYGYQIEIDSTDRAWSGGLYDEARRGWLDDLKEDEDARRAFRRADWNHYRIECVGPRIRAWVNGVQTADHIDPLDLEGVIGLQVHSGDNTRVRWRDLRLQDLGRHVWAPAETRALEGGLALVPPDGAAAWRDFAVRLRYRTEPPFEVVLHSESKVVSTASRITADVLREAHGEGEWSELFVAAYGPRLVFHVDGRQLGDLKAERNAVIDAIELRPAEGTLPVEAIEVLRAEPAAAK